VANNAFAFTARSDLIKFCWPYNTTSYERRHCKYFYFASGMGTKCCDLRICVYVCMSVCPLEYLKIIRRNFTKFSVHVICGRGSVILWRKCNTLCTSGFVCGVMFARNGMIEMHTGHCPIIYRNSPGGAGGEICCRLLPCLSHILTLASLCWAL